MVNEGSIGSPSFKQIFMQKETTQEGVRISGYERLKQNSGKTSRKDKKGVKEPSSNPQIKGKENEGMENSEGRYSTGKKLTANKEKQSKENG